MPTISENLGSSVAKTLRQATVFRSPLPETLILTSDRGTITHVCSSIYHPNLAPSRSKRGAFY